MLILTLVKGDRIRIGDHIAISIHEDSGTAQVKIAFDAPPAVKILRDSAIRREPRAAAGGA